MPSLSATESLARQPENWRQRVPTVRTVGQIVAQAQGRSYLEFMHRAGLMQLTAAMDRDTWAVVDCPPSCQMLVDSLCVRAGTATPAAQNGTSQAEADDGDLPGKQPLSVSLATLPRVCLLGPKVKATAFRDTDLTLLFFTFP